MVQPRPCVLPSGGCTQRSVGVSGEDLPRGWGAGQAALYSSLLNVPWPHRLRFNCLPLSHCSRRGRGARAGGRPMSGRDRKEAWNLRLYSPTLTRSPRPHPARTRETLQVLIPRSGAKSTTFRHNLISFSINTKCKLCPSDSILPVAVSASFSAGFARRNVRGACF